MPEFNPVAGQWGVVRSRHGFSTVRIDKVTPKLITERVLGNHHNKVFRDTIVGLFATQGEAWEFENLIAAAREPFKDEFIAENERHLKAKQDINARQNAAIDAVLAATPGAE